MRRGVFEVTDGVTGMKESLKDTVKGGMRNIFGGAPTSATGAADEWEDDRRRTVTENRRKKILGSTDYSHGPGETYNGSGASPLEQHLNTLAGDGSDPEEKGSGSGGVDAGGVHVAGMENGEGAGAGIMAVVEEPTQQGGAMDGILGVGATAPSSIEHPGAATASNIAAGREDTAGAGAASNQAQAQAQGSHPFMRDTYPPKIIPERESIHEDEYVEDSSDDEYSHSHNVGGPTVETVDPSTFFISPSPPPQRDRAPSSMVPRREVPESFDFELKDNSIKGKIGGAFQSMSSMVKIPIPIPSLRRRRGAAFDDSGWSDDEGSWQRQHSPSKSKAAIQQAKAKAVAPRRMTSNASGSGGRGVSGSVDGLLMRRMTSSPVMKKGTANLLSRSDIKKLGRVGRSKAVLDIATMAFGYAMIQEVRKVIGSGLGSGSGLNSFSMESFYFPTTSDDWQAALQGFLQFLNIGGLAESWAPFALVAAFLSICTKNLLFTATTAIQSNGISKSLSSDLQYSQLYLRLTTGTPLREGLGASFQNAIRAQGKAVVEIARLRSFLLITLAITLAATAAVIKPIGVTILAALLELVSYEGLREWPVDWQDLGVVLKDSVAALGTSLFDILEAEYHKIAANPLGIIVTASFVGVLCFASQLPIIESTRSAKELKKSKNASSMESRNDIEAKASKNISNMGVSSASRLALHMEDGAIERTLARSQVNNGHSQVKNRNSIILQRLAYIALSASLASMPLFVQAFVTFTIGTPIDWDRFSGIILALMFTAHFSKQALFRALDVSRKNTQVAPFLSVLANTLGEVNASNAQVRLPTASSPGKGLEVSDLWTAHVAKRAWACRGATISAKAGEIVLILGDESSGKTRLLTSIGENIASPPSQSRTTNMARGKIAIGGVETNKWQQIELKRKVGLMLNDVRTLSDMSQMNSGLKLQEVLRPTCPIGTHEGAIQSSIGVATQLTGLSSILPRMPAKLATVAIASEDELISSDSNRIPLSTSEWSKVLLTKLIAQIVLTNDNPLSAPNSVKRSLVGSVLLLDDVTNYLNELEEIKLIKSLRSSGAATLLTSRRWATGRFADKIAVMKNGSIVESGSHSELLAKGANNSIYAKMWADMTA